MKTSQFDYDLPEELIAQYPPEHRDSSRLLVYSRESRIVSHKRFSQLEDYLEKGDALVINNSSVFKARLLGKRKSGAAVEVLLIRPRESQESEEWIAMACPTRRLRANERILFDSKHWLTLIGEIGDGYWHVSFESTDVRKKIISRFGHVPLPPYINREDGALDSRRYQTVYADPEKKGAVAAPTAGFHFTEPLILSLKEKGVRIVELTLHVGPGTFKPMQVDEIDEHTVDPEMAELSELAAGQINQTREEGGKIVAVGTTSVRTLESAQFKSGEILPYRRMVGLYIKPGYKFRVVDQLITNFHLPKSSLLVLVSALTGREALLRLYREAIERDYRFYSYGDAMMIL